MGGISGVISAVALLGFLLFLLGVGLVVVSSSQGRPVRSGVLLAIIGLVAGILLTIIGQGILVLAPTEVAVITNTITGDVVDFRQGGTSVVIPVVQNVPVTYPTTQQNYTMSATAGEGNFAARDDAVEARTRDGQTVRLDVTVLFAVDPQQVETLYLRFAQTDYVDSFVRPQAREAVRDAVVDYTAENLYGAERTDLSQQIQEDLSARFAVAGLRLDDLLVRDVTFSEQFSQAVEEAARAQQEAERARRQVQQRQAEADQAREVAAGEADARIERARGEAQSTLLAAQAQAEALSLISEQLAANPNLIQYLYVQNLSDNVSLALIPSNSPFLFDLNTLLPANNDVQVPDVRQIVPESTPNAPGG